MLMSLFALLPMLLSVSAGRLIDRMGHGGRWASLCRARSGGRFALWPSRGSEPCTSS